MKKITRSVRTTTIQYSMARYENETVQVTDMEPFITDETVKDEKSALKLLRKKHEFDIIIIKDIQTEEAVYAISYEDFMAKAEKIVRPLSQRKQ